MTVEEAIKIIGGAWSLMCQTNIRFDFITDYREAAEIAVKALNEVQKYREIGTVEECREAVEKQKAKEIVCENDSVFSNGFSHYRIGRCPMCDRYYNSNDEVNYCSKCGQAIQWDENLEGMEE